MENSYHIPVLLSEAVNGLAINPSGVYVDVTFGGGGHSREILSRLNEHGKLYAFDQDEDAKRNNIDDPRFELIDANFRYLKKFLRFNGVKQVDGILGDFGVSSHQFNVAERGFSTRFDAKLDMRMNQQDKLSAYQLVNEYDEENLTRVLRDYGEFRIASKIAQAIISKRNEAPIETTQQLNEVVSAFFSSLKLNKMLAMAYQAIRIEVNHEMDALKEFLIQTAEVVKPGGRISLIAYHSLEDRLVKRYIRAGNFDGEAEKDFFGRIHVPFKKAGGLITPSNDELKQNSRSRSAKLRIAERLKDE